MLRALYSFIQSLMGYKSFGEGSIIKYPCRINNKQDISIGKNVFVVENSFFAVWEKYGKQKFKPSVKISNNVRIGGNFILGCINKVTIEEDVIIADRVFISDHVHDYSNPGIPISKQKLESRGEVIIRKGAFIGVNSVVLHGVTIGRNSVIGASSVVTTSIPDYCVAVGSPAKVVKKYDNRLKKWVQIKKIK